VSLLELEPHRLDPTLTVRELATEHRAARPGRMGQREIERWWRGVTATARRLGGAAAPLATVELDDTLVSLSPERRALGLAALAASHGSTVHLIDAGGLARPTIDAADALIVALAEPQPARLVTGDAASEDAAALTLDPLAPAGAHDARTPEALLS
jgi:hypothetical protein